MEFLKNSLIFLVLVTFVISVQAAPTNSEEEDAKEMKDFKITSIPANDTFQLEEVLPDGEVRAVDINGANRKWDQTPPDGAAPPKVRIVGGRKTRTYEVPYQISIGLFGFGQWCGGAVYNKDWVITASHCFFNSNGDLREASDYYINAGEYDLNRKDKGEQIRTVEKFVIHPDYAPSPGLDDIALIKLNEPLEYAEGVQPLLMPPATETYPEGPGLISGWGYTRVRDNRGGFEDGGFTSTLKSTRIHVFTKEQCQEIYKNVRSVRKHMNSPSVMCAGELKGGKDACQGDSGGPLACKNEKKERYLCGIISTGIGCGLPQRPGLFTIVSHYVDWVKSVAGEGDYPTVNY